MAIEENKSISNLRETILQKIKDSENDFKWNSPIREIQ